jgi:hypothetical protein
MPFFLSKRENTVPPRAFKFKTAPATAKTGYFKGHMLKVKLLEV